MEADAVHDNMEGVELTSTWASSVPAPTAPDSDASLKRSRDDTDEASTALQLGESAAKRARLTASSPTPSAAFTLVMDKALVQRSTLTVASAKGFRTARTSLGVAIHAHADSTSAWYAEVRCDVDTALVRNIGSGSGESSSGGAVQPHWRIGVASTRALLSAPVGYQILSVGLRDVDGTRVFDARRSHVPVCGPFGAGSTVGVLVVQLRRGSRVLVSIDGGPLTLLYSDLHTALTTTPTLPLPPPPPGTETNTSLPVLWHVAASLYYGASATFVLQAPWTHPPPATVPDTSEDGAELAVPVRAWAELATLPHVVSAPTPASQPHLSGL